MSNITLRICRPPDNNEKARDQETEPFSPIANTGIVLGAGSQATFKLDGDPEVNAAHGTLERTSGLGIWVYSDHSKQGSSVNGRNVHNDAVVVHHGDKLKLGATEIELRLETGKTQAEPQDPEEEKEKRSPIGTNQEENHLHDVPTTSRRRASTPWGSSFSNTQQMKQRQLKIETSGLGFVEPGTFGAVQPMATPPEYTASPVPGTRWRRKRNSIATTTLMAARSPPSPKKHGHPNSFHRPRTRFVKGSEVPPIEQKGENKGPPPPLEYSSSPKVSPSSLARQRHSNIFQQPPKSLPTAPTGLIAGVPPPPCSTGNRPTARRDDLRIQVSKKMAAAAPAISGTSNAPRVTPKALEFQAPASPVAQRDILKQQESLQTILQHKNEEEQLLKQQQEEWMRKNLMPLSSPGSSTPSALSPIKTERNSLADINPDELAFFPVQAPVLLRTLSLGISEQRTMRPSPRLTAAIRASRARLNSFEEKPDQSARKGRRKTTALVFDRDLMEIPRSPAKKNELRTSNESVASTASTVVTCHRRVTSSVSSGSADSVDLCDFMGYEDEEDTADAVTSYTTPDLYGSDDLLRRSTEDTLLFDASRNSSSMYGTLSPPPSNNSSCSPSNTADTRLGSPRRQGTDTPDTSSSSSNQLLNDTLDQTIALGSRVLSPRGGHFDPRSPYKSTKNQQQLRRPAPEPEEGEDTKLRRRTSFRRHSLTPLLDLPDRKSVV